jgi:hypothetical protein
MRKSITLIAALCLPLAGPALAQHDDDRAAAAAKAAFQQKYPGASGAEWEKDDGAFEVEFKQDGQEMEAGFSDKGEWLWTETAVALNRLPQPVLESMSQQFPQARVNEAFKVEDGQHGVYYALETESDGRAQELAFSPEGEWLKALSETEDEGAEDDGDAGEDDEEDDDGDDDN